LCFIQDKALSYVLQECDATGDAMKYFSLAHNKNKT